MGIQQTFPFLKKIAHAIPAEPDSEYRYVLYRSLDGEEWNQGFLATSEFSPNRLTVCFVMLNPSRASAETSDPTIDKLMKFGRAWGYARLTVVNLFAIRETDSKKLRALASGKDIVGPDNDTHIRRQALSAHKVVCAWGKEGVILDRGAGVASRLTELVELQGQPLWCFKKNLDGTPVHPLYQRDAAALVEYR